MALYQSWRGHAHFLLQARRDCDVQIAGDTWFFHEEMEGWDALVEHLEQLPGFRADWHDVNERSAMDGSRLALFSVLAMMSVPKAFANAPATEEALARSALVGMQLSVRKAAAQGKVPDDVAVCVARLPSESFVPIFHSVLEQNMSADEIAAAEKFFQGEVGRKFAKAGIAQAYVAVGEQPPEPVPDVSESEYAELEQFSRTAAGQKLWVQKVMEGPSVRQAISARIAELLDSCRSK
jgi:hypothetical protein